MEKTTRYFIRYLLALPAFLFSGAAGLAQNAVAPKAKELFDQGETALAAGNYQQAVSLYTKAIKLEPTFGRAYLRRGEAQERLENMNEAYQDYTKAIDINPNDHLAWYHRGALFFKLQKTTPP